MLCVCVLLSYSGVEEVVRTELAQQRPPCGVQWRLWWCMWRLASIWTHPEGNQGFSISSVPTCTFLACAVRCIWAKREWVPGVASASRATTGTWSSCVREQDFWGQPLSHCSFTWKRIISWMFLFPHDSVTQLCILMFLFKWKQLFHLLSRLTDGWQAGKNWMKTFSSDPARVKIQI